MTQDEIIDIANDMAFMACIWIEDDSNEFKDMVAFAKLVEDKVRRELREEIIYTWVPPSFVDFAIKAEREACANVADQYVGQDLEHNFSALIAHNIRARGEA